jgi:hypothetical protein
VHLGLPVLDYSLRRLKLKCAEPLSNFAFNFDVRRYMVGAAG